VPGAYYATLAAATMSLTHGNASAVLPGSICSPRSIALVETATRSRDSSNSSSFSTPLPGHPPDQVDPRQYSHTIERTRSLARHTRQAARVYVQHRTQAHGSCLNLIEGFFFSHCPLGPRPIRGNQITNIKSALCRYDDVNRHPFIHTWSITRRGCLRLSRTRTLT